MEEANNTLYCRNLDDKINPDLMKACLFEAFSSHGELLDVHVRKNHKMRGQAFVVFKEQNAAIVGLKKMNGHEFLGKPLQLAFAKSKSDAVAIAEGTYKLKRRKPVKSGTA